jgi:hypothetical protein
MGAAPAGCKRLDAAQTRPATGPIPGSAIGPRLIISVGFDKGSRRPIQRPLTIEQAFACRLIVSVGFDPFLYGPVYHLFSGPRREIAA